MQLNFIPCRLSENQSRFWRSRKPDWFTKIVDFGFVDSSQRNICATLISYRNDHLALLFIQVDIHRSYDIKRNWRRKRMSPDVTLQRYTMIMATSNNFRRLLIPRLFPRGCYYNRGPQLRTATSFRAHSCSRERVYFAAKRPRFIQSVAEWGRQGF